MQRRRHERMEGSLFLLLCVATPYWIGRLGRLQCVRHSFVGLSGWIATEGLVMMGQVSLSPGEVGQSGGLQQGYIASSVDGLGAEGFADSMAICRGSYEAFGSDE